MPKERWIALDPQSQKIWDQLSDKAKAPILGYRSDNRSPDPGPLTRQVHWHDLPASGDAEEDHFCPVPVH